jgi:hypothetical protein
VPLVSESWSGAGHALGAIHSLDTSGRSSCRRRAAEGSPDGSDWDRDTVKRDPFYQQILERLGGPLDSDLFERCAADLLRREHPTLVPIRGGSDAGMDGAIADGEGTAYPLVTTTGTNVIGNLDRNLEAYKAGGGSRRKAILATAQELTARRRRNLEKRAEELGFILVQIYDQAALRTASMKAPPGAANC